MSNIKNIKIYSIVLLLHVAFYDIHANNIHIQHVEYVKAEMYNGILAKEIFSKENTKYFITSEFIIDDVIEIPNNCILDFSLGGYIKSGVIKGNSTQIYASKHQQVFGKEVKLTGTWYGKIIYLKWFSPTGDGYSDDTQVLENALLFDSQEVDGQQGIFFITPNLLKRQEIRSVKAYGIMIDGGRKIRNMTIVLNKKVPLYTTVLFFSLDCKKSIIELDNVHIYGNGDVASADIKGIRDGGLNLIDVYSNSITNKEDLLNVYISIKNSTFKYAGTDAINICQGNEKSKIEILIDNCIFYGCRRAALLYKQGVVNINNTFIYTENNNALSVFSGIAAPQIFCEPDKYNKKYKVRSIFLKNVSHKHNELQKQSPTFKIDYNTPIKFDEIVIDSCDFTSFSISTQGMKRTSDLEINSINISNSNIGKIELGNFYEESPVKINYDYILIDSSSIGRIYKCNIFCNKIVMKNTNYNGFQIGKEMVFNNFSLQNCLCNMSNDTWLGYAALPVNGNGIYNISNLKAQMKSSYLIRCIGGDAIVSVEELWINGYNYSPISITENFKGKVVFDK